jgi:hypothetical protein
MNEETKVYAAEVILRESTSPANDGVEVITREDTSNADTTNCSIQLGASITLLDRDMDIILNSTDECTEFIMMPKKVEKGKGLTITDFVNGIDNFVKKFTSKAVVNPESITKALEKFIKPDSVTINIEQAFIHVLKYKDKETPGTTPPKTEKDQRNTFEYAFKVSLNCTPTTAEENKLFAFHSFSFAIWNTELPGVIDEMNLVTVKNLLDRYKKTEEHGKKSIEA